MEGASARCATGHAAFLTFRDRSALARQESDGYPVLPVLYLLFHLITPSPTAHPPFPFLDEHTPYTIRPEPNKKPTYRCVLYCTNGWAGVNNTS